MLGVLRRAIPNAIRRRYALKFGIALLCLGVVVASVGVVATTQVESEVKQGAEDEYAQVAQQESAELATWNERNRELATDLAATVAVRSGDAAAIDSLFANRSDRTGIYRIDYVDLQAGEVEVSTRLVEGNGLGALAIDDTDRLQQAADADGAGFYGAYELDSVQAMTYVAATPNGEHAVLVTMDADAVSNDLRGATEDGAVTVLDPQRRILFDSQSATDIANYLQSYDAANGDRYVNARSESVGFSNALVAESTDSILTREDGYALADEPYVAAYSPVEGTDWVVVVHEPTSTAFGFVQQISQYGLLVTGGIVLLIGLVGLVLGRNTTRSVNTLREKAQRMEEGDLDVAFDTHRIDAIGQLYVGFASMRDALGEQIRDARDAREAAEAARAEAEQMNRHLERKASEYSDVMRACAAGDLTERMDPDSESDAMEAIATEFNAMVAEIEATTAEVKTFASEVAIASEEVTASSEEVRSASEQVTESIQEISDGADRQNQSLQSVSGEMEQLSTTTEQIAASSNEVADLAERTADTGRHGRDAAEAAIGGMAELEDESESAVAAIEALEAEMSEIDDLIEFISDIAKETNMLALNANIEASRGGTDGGEGDEGFAVVAQEVKELASETKDAADDIEERLERIQAQTEHTAGEVQQTADRVAEHTESVQEAAGALEEIARYAQETNTGVQEISAATEQQAASTQEVVAMVDDAATVSEETTAESENVAAAAEEQTTALTEVSNSASSLSEQASQLSAALDRFDTDTDAGGDAFDERTVEAAFEAYDDGEASVGELASEEASAEAALSDLDDDASDDDGGGGAARDEPSFEQTFDDADPKPFDEDATTGDGPESSADEHPDEDGETGAEHGEDDDEEDDEDDPFTFDD